MQQKQQNEQTPKTRLSALPERHSAPSEDFMRALAAWKRLKSHPPAESGENSAPPASGRA
jgi:hypothetical protein